MTGSNAEQAISQEKYVSVATFRLLDSMRHLGKGPFPYADTGVVITLQG